MKKLVYWFRIFAGVICLMCIIPLCVGASANLIDRSFITYFVETLRFESVVCLVVGIGITGVKLLKLDKQ